jgi:hypothetical protein
MTVNPRTGLLAVTVLTLAALPVASCAISGPSLATPAYNVFPPASSSQLPFVTPSYNPLCPLNGPSDQPWVCRKLDSATKTPRPTKTPPPSATPTTPTPTSTSLPPLEAHRWSPQRLLVRYDVFGGDGPCCLHESPANLTILSDGTVVITATHDETFRTLTTRLPRQQLCSLLNTIDRTGFLDYDPQPYLDQFSVSGPDGGNTTAIEVNVWRTNKVALPDLWLSILYRDEWLSDCPECPPLPDVPPSLRDIYLLLSQIQFDDLVPFAPSQLQLWADEPIDWELAELPPARPWPIVSPSLSTVFVDSQYPSDGTKLSGQLARVAYSVFDTPLSIFGQLFTEGGQTYVVFPRALLPGEDPSDPYKSPTHLQCSPADGLWPPP